MGGSDEGATLDDRRDSRLILRDNTGASDQPDNVQPRILVPTRTTQLVPWHESPVPLQRKISFWRSKALFSSRRSGPGRLCARCSYYDGAEQGVCRKIQSLQSDGASHKGQRQRLPSTPRNTNGLNLHDTTAAKRSGRVPEDSPS